MADILLIEDDPSEAERLLYALRKAAFRVAVAENGEKGLEKARGAPPDLVVLDLGLPGMSGFEVCLAMRKDERLRTIPILVLTGSSDEAACVRALECGADDYVCKPFRVAETIARIQALLRRAASPPAALPEKIEAGPLVIDLAAHAVRMAGERVNLSPVEFHVLCVLASNANRVVSRNQLLDAVWGQRREVTPRSVDTYVYNLRLKLEKDSRRPRYLKTLRSFGYVLDVEGRFNEDS